MNAEEQHTIASERLKKAIIGFAIFSGITSVIVVAGVVYAIESGIAISEETVIIGVAVLSPFFIIPIIILARRASALERLLWKELAERYGFTYVHKPYFQSAALVFQEGHSRATVNGLTGTLSDRPFRLFQYNYTVGTGKNKQYHTYCVAEVAFAGTFPHLYLNNTKNRDLSNLKGLFLPRLSLPHELEGTFNLHCPKEYEIEALEIFTPDILAHILDAGWEHDLELVDQKLYVFREIPIINREALEYELARLKELLEMLAPKLNRMKLEKVGDRKTTL